MHARGVHAAENEILWEVHVPFQDGTIRIISVRRPEGRWIPQYQICSETPDGIHVREFTGDANNPFHSREEADEEAWKLAVC
jgi:hypothetical protein